MSALRPQLSELRQVVVFEQIREQRPGARGLRFIPASVTRIRLILGEELGIAQRFVFAAA